MPAAAAVALATASGTAAPPRGSGPGSHPAPRDAEVTQASAFFGSWAGTTVARPAEV